MGRPTVFVSYSHKDEHWKDLLVTQLSVLGKQGLLDLWDDRRIGAGQRWQAEIEQAMATASVAVLLVSANSLTSDFILREEVSRLLQRRDADGLPVIPIVIRPCAWKAVSWLAEMQVRPRDGRPVSQGNAHAIDEDFAAITEEIFKLLREYPQGGDARTASPLPEENTLAESAPRAGAVAGDDAAPPPVEQGIADARRHLAEVTRPNLSEGRHRIVGSLPEGVSEQFKDRTEVAARITDLLLNPGHGVRAVIVLGRGGIGKTALACKILKALETDSERVDGLIYLGTRTSTGITFEDIYLGSARMLGGESEKALMRTWASGERSTQDKIQRLIERLRGGRYLVLLDNLEDLLSADGVLQDPDLRLLFEALLRQDHGARLLVTSREEPRLPGELMKYRSLIHLDEGLAVPDATEFLRDVDQSGELGLRDADRRTLEAVAEKTYGIPRALEAVVGMISESPWIPVEQLMEDEATFRKAITESLVRLAHERMGLDARRVMQALAVFNRPVPEAGILWLLEPHADRAEITAAIRRLWRGRFINIRREAGNSYISVHPIDRDYGYGQIPTDPPQGYNLRELERRAAGFYRRLRLDPAEWTSIEALEPQLLEFEHLLRAGDYDEAAAVLSEIDVSYLIYRGRARRVLAMRQALADKIRSPRLSMLHESALGQCYLTVGPLEAAVDHLLQALRLARELSDRQAEMTLLERLGTTRRLMGRVADAENHLSEALRMSREIGDTKESVCLLNLGLTFAYRGRAREALDCARRLLELAEHGRGEPLELQRAHNVLALAYLMTGNAPQAKIHAEKALDANRAGAADRGAWAEPDLTDAVPYIRNLLGMAYLQLGHAEEATTEFGRVVAEARELEQPRPEAFALFNQARLCRRNGDAVQALRFADQSAEVLRRLSHPAASAAAWLAEAVRASLRQDRPGEAEAIVACARSALELPDLHDPLDLALEAEVLAEEVGRCDLAATARDLAGVLRARRVV